VTEVAQQSEWPYLRAGLIAVSALIGAALIAWGVQTARYEDRGFEQVSDCLRFEKGVPFDAVRDPIARSAELGALRMVIETNGVTMSVAGDAEEAQRMVAAYQAVAGDLGTRLERRGRIVYLWDRRPSTSQRQTLYDCEY
jgi:hypothetical protein